MFFDPNARVSEAVARSLDTQVRPIFKPKLQGRPTSNHSSYIKRLSTNSFSKSRAMRTLEHVKSPLKPVVFQLQLFTPHLNPIRAVDRNIYLRMEPRELPSPVRPKYEPLLKCSQVKACTSQNSALIASQTILTQPRLHLQPQSAIVNTRNQSEASKATGETLESESRKLKFHKSLVFTNNDNTLKFYVSPGNNKELVERILARRERFCTTSQSNSMINFRWTQTTERVKFQHISSSSGFKQAVNHFQGHQEISTKSGLLNSLKAKCQRDQKQNLFDIIPITFEIDFTSDNCEDQFKRFLHFFVESIPVQEGCPRPNKKSNYKQCLEFIRKLKPIYNIQNTSYEKREHPYSKPLIKEVYRSGKNSYLWLLKPTSLNRGRGIYIFQTLEELIDIILEYFQRNAEKGGTSKSPMVKGKNQSQSVASIQNKYVRASCFVVQKYIERPLLISSRKFDIRVWVLVTHNMDVYFFKEGYVRTSCKEFEIQNKDLYVHLTNNAIQKNSEQYGQFQEGNQLSFNDMQVQFTKTQSHLTDDPTYQPVSFRQGCVPDMKKKVLLSLEAVRKRLDPHSRKYTFELFGYDFMLDTDYKVWLIEVNTNPCIEESSPLLAMLIPRMLDDAFRLTIDQIFKSRACDIGLHVEGYADNENMWEFQGSLRTNDSPTK